MRNFLEIWTLHSGTRSATRPHKGGVLCRPALVPGNLGDGESDPRFPRPA